jgi:hypothetical protein
MDGLSKVVINAASTASASWVVAGVIAMILVKTVCLHGERLLAAVDRRAAVRAALSARDEDERKHALQLVQMLGPSPRAVVIEAPTRSTWLRCGHQNDIPSANWPDSGRLD